MRRFLSDRGGATSIEYAVIASLVGLLLVTALMSIGGSLQSGLQDAAAGLGL